MLLFQKERENLRTVQWLLCVRHGAAAHPKPGKLDPAINCGKIPTKSFLTSHHLLGEDW